MNLRFISIWIIGILEKKLNIILMLNRARESTWGLNSKNLWWALDESATTSKMDNHFHLELLFINNYINFFLNYEMGLKIIRIMWVLKFSKFSCFSTISFELSKGYIYDYQMHLRCGYTCIAFNTTLVWYHLSCVTSRAYIQESYSKPQIWRPISKPIFKDPHWRPISRLKYRNPLSRLPYKPNQPSKH